MKSKKIPNSGYISYFAKKIKDEVHRKKGHHHQVVDSRLGHSGHQEFSVQEPVCFGAGFARPDRAVGYHQRVYGSLFRVWLVAGRHHGRFQGKRKNSGRNSRQSGSHQGLDLLGFQGAQNRHHGFMQGKFG